MKTMTLTACGLILTLAGTGCATKKYVAKTVSPVEARVSQTEGKNADQDKQISAHGTQIEELDRDLSRTKEKLSDTDSKATAAGRAAKEAADRADGAQKSADNAGGLAQKGLDRTVQLEHTMDAMNKFQMLKSETVLFDFGKAKLKKDAEAQLEELVNAVSGRERYVIEVQGFTDATGSPTFNERLSDERAQAVARYLANEKKIPVRSISLLGSGAAQPVGDDKTKDGRKMNRRVEVRVFVPEAESVGKATTASAKE